MLEGFAIILSVVSLIVTVVGFFASLKFYRDGVELQQSANNALTKLEEKTQFIQAQVGGMFDKTLDAAIGKREILADQFEELNEQLEKTKTKLIEESIGRIGAAGEQERARLTSLVDDQISLIREKVKTTQESAKQVVRGENDVVKETLLRTFYTVVSSTDGIAVTALYDKLGIAPKSTLAVLVSNYLKDMESDGRFTFRDGKWFAMRPAHGQ